MNSLKDSSPDLTFLAAFLRTRITKLRRARQDHGAISIETMMIIAGLVAVAAIAVGVITAKVRQKANSIK